MSKRTKEPPHWEFVDYDFNNMIYQCSYCGKIISANQREYFRGKKGSIRKCPYCKADMFSWENE